MNTQQDELIALLESYVLAPNKEAYIKTLVPNSENHKMILTIHELNFKGLGVSSEAADYLKKWRESVPSQSSRNFPILIRHLLMTLEKENSKDKVTDLIRSIDRITDNTYKRLVNYSKPVIFAAGEEFKEDSENKMSSELTCKVDQHLYLEDIASKVTENPHYLNSLTDTAILYHIDLEKAAKNQPESVSQILNRIPNFANLTVSHNNQEHRSGNQEDPQALQNEQLLL
jgi:hypothetical protein